MSALAELVRHTEVWHAERASGIGASDVPAILGLSSYGTAVTVWERKTGQAAVEPTSSLADWGHRLEPVLAEAAAEKLGVRFRRRARAVRYRDWPVLFAHLDRDSTEGPLECKAAMSSRGWGEDGSAEVPPHVSVQVQVQLLCAGVSAGWVATLLGYRDFRTYRIARNDELLFDEILPVLREFWTCVEDGIPPAPDGSESYSAFLRRRYPSDQTPERPATPEEQVLVRHLMECRVELGAAELQERRAVQLVQEAIGEAGGLLAPGVRISYRQNKPTEKVEWERLARLLGANTQPDLVAEFTTIRPGARVFRVTEEET